MKCLTEITCFRIPVIVEYDSWLTKNENPWNLHESNYFKWIFQKISVLDIWILKIESLIDQRINQNQSKIWFHHISILYFKLGHSSLNITLQIMHEWLALYSRFSPNINTYDVKNLQLSLLTRLDATVSM